ncbi:MAG TPA: aspartate/glutamate racemase family protein [Hyphomicrobiaceae bacterium]|nr:aspartate/glutamate racemase family protein [Hyphomicrobiaceae bacterium]
MLIRVVNPNTTIAMTATIAAAAREAASPTSRIDAVTSPTGPVSIEGYYDEALCLPGLLLEIAKGEALAAAGHVIACFDDTGLDAARQVARAPVVGIGEAAYHAATLVAHRFTIVTTLGRSVPALETNLLRYGFERRAKVRAAEVPVLALDDPRSDARGRINAEIARALREDRAEAIVLGCAGMAKLARDLSAEHGCPVIDGVGVAVKLVEMLATLGHRTSKRVAYEWTGAKQLSGPIADLMGPR